MNDKIVGITPAMPTGCSMNMLFNSMPDRAFDVGIAEQHAVTFSAGLAPQGMVTFCNIYSTFMQTRLRPDYSRRSLAEIAGDFLSRPGRTGWRRRPHSPRGF